MGLAQELQAVRGEVDDEQPAARGDQPPGLGDRGGRVGLLPGTRSKPTRSMACSSAK